MSAPGSAFSPISIHALFAEGDRVRPQADQCRKRYFYPRPLRRGRLRALLDPPERTKYFYPRPLRRGRPRRARYAAAHYYFYPRPLRRGRPPRPPNSPRGPADFYPRPLRRGRRHKHAVLAPAAVFLSTPSSQRATRTEIQLAVEFQISIHALFAEGDQIILMYQWNI